MTCFSIGHVHQLSVKQVGLTGGATKVKYAISSSGMGVSSLCVCVLYFHAYVLIPAIIMQPLGETSPLCGDNKREVRRDRTQQ
jgi:hypothetical protein